MSEREPNCPDCKHSLRSYRTRRKGRLIFQCANCDGWFMPSDILPPRAAPAPVSQDAQARAQRIVTSWWGIWNEAGAINRIAAAIAAAVLAERTECERIVQRYIDTPTSGENNNTPEAFNRGMNHEAGCIDSASAILDAIRARSEPGRGE